MPSVAANSFAIAAQLSCVNMSHFSNAPVTASRCNAVSDVIHFCISSALRSCVPLCTSNNSSTNIFNVFTRSLYNPIICLIVSTSHVKCVKKCVSTSATIASIIFSSFAHHYVITFQIGEEEQAEGAFSLFFTQAIRGQENAREQA